MDYNPPSNARPILHAMGDETMLSALILSLLAATQTAPAASVASSTPAPPTSASIESLAWMAGAWGGESSGIQMEEIWLAPKGGVMLGMHRDVRSGRLLMFEYFRVEQTPEGLVYQAQPKGRPPVPFKAIELGAKRVVFSNPEHDFPQRILYWLDDDGLLHARVEGPLGGKETNEEWAWKRSRID